VLPKFIYFFSPPLKGTRITRSCKNHLSRSPVTGVWHVAYTEHTGRPL